MPQLNEEIRDDYIVLAIDVQKTTAQLGRLVDAKMVKLSRELAELTRRIDPSAPAARRFKERRKRVLTEKGNDLIRRRYSEIEVLIAEYLKSVGKMEQEHAEDLLRRKLNGV